MSTAIQPDPQSTQDNSPPSPNSQEQSQDSSSQITQQTPTTPSPPTDDPRDRYTQLLEATLRENNQRIQQLQNEVQSVRQASAPVASETPASDPAAFFNNPQAELDKFRKQINEDLQRTVSPLLELAKGLRGDGTPYGNLKNQFANDPRYSAVLADPKVSMAVDKIMENQSHTPEIMRAAIVQATGLKATGELDIALVQSGVDISRFNGPSVQPSQTSTPSTVSTVPAHMRPTAPPAPTNTQPDDQPRKLTEMEKRLARERGQTDAEYLQWLEIPANQVTSSQIGRNK